MRLKLINALAPHVGTMLTPEAATAILSQFPAEGAPIDLASIPPARSGSVVFQAERGADILDELDVLHSAHWAETEAYRHHIPLNPDIAACIADEQAGRLIQFTARDGRELIGNLRMYLATSRHTQRTIATEDSMYLLPAYRGGRLALRFLQYMERCLYGLGVTEVYMDDKVANPSAARLVEFLGYQHIANRRHKRLTRENINVR